MWLYFLKKCLLDVWKWFFVASFFSYFFFPKSFLHHLHAFAFLCNKFIVHSSKNWNFNSKTSFVFFWDKCLVDNIVLICYFCVSFYLESSELIWSWCLFHSSLLLQCIHYFIMVYNNFCYHIVPVGGTGIQNEFCFFFLKKLNPLWYSGNDHLCRRCLKACFYLDEWLLKIDCGINCRFKLRELVYLVCLFVFQNWILRNFTEVQSKCCVEIQVCCLRGIFVQTWLSLDQLSLEKFEINS